MASKGTQFSADRQPRNRRGKSKSALIEEALKRQSLTVDEFYDKILKLALGGDAQMMKEVLSRLHPVPRATAPMINFDYRPESTPVEKIEAIIDGVSTGEIPADIANIVVGMIKAGMEAREVTEILERLEALEKMIQEQKNG